MANAQQIAADSAADTERADFMLGLGRAAPKDPDVSEAWNFAGQTVYSWGSPAKPDPVNRKKTYAELLLVDLPARVAVAQSLARDSGDLDEAKAELAEVDKFVQKNGRTLREFLRYQGSNPAALEVQQQARKLVTGEYRKDFATLLDPRTNPAAVPAMGRRLGLDSAEGLTVLKGVADNDPRSLAVWDELRFSPPAAGVKPAGAKDPAKNSRAPAREAAEPPPEAADDADRSGSPSEQLKRLLQAESVILGGVQVTDDDRAALGDRWSVRAAGQLSRIGDRETGNRYAKMVNDGLLAAKTEGLSGQDFVNRADQLVAGVGKLAGAAAGADGATRASFAKAYESVAKSYFKGKTSVFRDGAEADRVARAAGAALNYLRQGSKYGTPVNDEAVAGLLTVELARQGVIPRDSLTPGDRALADKFDELGRIGSRVKVSPAVSPAQMALGAGAGKGPAEPEETPVDSWQVFPGTIRSVYGLAGAEIAADRSLTVKQAVMKHRGILEDLIMGTGEVDRKTAESLSGAMLSETIDSGSADPRRPAVARTLPDSSFVTPEEAAKAAGDKAVAAFRLKNGKRPAGGTLGAAGDGGAEKPSETEAGVRASAEKKVYADFAAERAADPATSGLDRALYETLRSTKTRIGYGVDLKPGSKELGDVFSLVRNTIAGNQEELAQALEEGPDGLRSRFSAFAGISDRELAADPNDLPGSLALHVLSRIYGRDMTKAFEARSRGLVTPGEAMPLVGGVLSGGRLSLPEQLWAGKSLLDIASRLLRADAGLSESEMLSAPEDFAETRLFDPKRVSGDMSGLRKSFAGTEAELSLLLGVFVTEVLSPSKATVESVAKALRKAAPAGAAIPASVWNARAAELLDRTASVLQTLRESGRPVPGDARVADVLLPAERAVGIEAKARPAAALAELRRLGNFRAGEPAGDKYVFFDGDRVKSLDKAEMAAAWEKVQKEFDRPIEDRASREYLRSVWDALKEEGIDPVLKAGADAELLRMARGHAGVSALQNFINTKVIPANRSSAAAVKLRSVYETERVKAQAKAEAERETGAAAEVDETAAKSR